MVSEGLEQDYHTEIANTVLNRNIQDDGDILVKDAAYSPLSNTVLLNRAFSLPSRLARLALLGHRTLKRPYSPRAKGAINPSILCPSARTAAPALTCPNFTLYFPEEISVQCNFLMKYVLNSAVCCTATIECICQIVSFSNVVGGRLNHTN